MQENPQLNGKNVTEVIGGVSPELEKVRRNFMKLLDFRGLDLLPSLRRLFWMFHMEGETQVIDRIISDFSEEYINQNPESVLIDSSSVYVYTSCILMLNTNLHKP